MTTDRRHALGRLGEDIAARHLERLGYVVEARRHRTRFGELDVVARDGDVLVFVEVKTRRPGPTGPWAALGEAKRAQVRRMARAYLAEAPRQHYTTQLRFDAIGVTLDAAGRLVALEHLEGAF